MDVKIHTHQLEMSEALKEYAERHIAATLSNIYRGQGGAALDIEFSLAVGGREKVCKVTMFVPRGKTLVASAQDANPYAAVDLVAEKISRELRHYKEKRQDNVKQGAKLPGSDDVTAAPVVGIDEYEGYEQFDTELEGKLVP